MSRPIGLDIVDFRSGVAARRARDAVEDIVRAEREGFAAAWLPVLRGGPGPLVTSMAAALHATRIRLATGVVRCPYDPLVQMGQRRS